MAADLVLGRPRRPIRFWTVGFAAGALLAGGVILAYMLLRSTGAPGTRPRPLPQVVSAAGLAERSGVRVVRVAASGGGGLLDLRYQVVDSSRAAAVHDSDTPPALVDERRGAVIWQLLMDHMHHGTMKNGVSYYLIFSNPGNLVHRGDRVSVVLGDARLDHIVVQ